MLSIAMITAAIAIGAQSGTEPAPNQATIKVFHEYYEFEHLDSRAWEIETKRTAQEFAALVDALGSGKLKASTPFELELAAIGRDRRRDPRMYEAIEREYLRTNALLGARGASPPMIRPEHRGNPTAWRYFFLRPYTPDQVDNFDKLAAWAVIKADQLAATKLINVYGTFLASNKILVTDDGRRSRGVLFARRIQFLLNLLEQIPSSEAARAVLSIGVSWNVLQRGASINYGPTYEGHVAQFLNPSRRDSYGASWRQTWGGLNLADFSKAERELYHRITATIKP